MNKWRKKEEVTDTDRKASRKHTGLWGAGGDKEALALGPWIRMAAMQEQAGSSSFTILSHPMISTYVALSVIVWSLSCGYLTKTNPYYLTLVPERGATWAFIWRRVLATWWNAKSKIVSPFGFCLVWTNFRATNLAVPTLNARWSPAGSQGCWLEWCEWAKPVKLWAVNPNQWAERR